jgi:hypothetical protein
MVAQVEETENVESSGKTMPSTTAAVSKKDNDISSPCATNTSKVGSRADEDVDEDDGGGRPATKAYETKSGKTTTMRKKV